MRYLFLVTILIISLKSMATIDNSFYEQSKVLNDEYLITEIFHFLNPEDVEKVGAVSKIIYDVSRFEYLREQSIYKVKLNTNGEWKFIHEVFPHDIKTINTAMKDESTDIYEKLNLLDELYNRYSFLQNTIPTYQNYASSYANLLIQFRLWQETAIRINTEMKKNFDSTRIQDICSLTRSFSLDLNSRYDFSQANEFYLDFDLIDEKIDAKIINMKLKKEIISYDSLSRNHRDLRPNANLELYERYLMTLFQIEQLLWLNSTEYKFTLSNLTQKIINNLSEKRVKKILYKIKIPINTSNNLVNSQLTILNNNLKIVNKFQKKR